MKINRKIWCVPLFTIIFFCASAYSAKADSITLSQNVLNMGANQSATITINNASGNVSVAQNTNPSVAIAAVFGNSLVITAYSSIGLTTMTICDSVNGCQNLTVSVLPSSISSFSIATNATNLIVGQSQSIALSGTGPFYISQNLNSTFVSAVINGSSLVVNGLAVGGTTITICQSNTQQCSNVSVYVNSTSNLSSNPTSPSITFSQNSANLATGQQESIFMYGFTSYYLSSNSNPTTASAHVSGTSLVINGLSVGTTNLSVCSTANQCANIPVSIVSNGNAVDTANSNIPLALTSFSLSSNNQGNSFLIGGSPLTINFVANQSITNPTISVNGIPVSVNGYSNGPYTASYNMTGSEGMPLPIVVSFSNSSGASVRQYFWTSNSATAPVTNTIVTPVTTTASTPTTAVNCPAGLICMPTATPVPAQGLVNTSVSNSSSSYTFNNYLYYNMNKIGQSNPDVVALQNRLAKDGFFSGASTGYFGPLTKVAVQAYQTKHNLSPLGVVGPATRNLLNEGI